MGTGIEMDFSEIGFKCNFASLDPISKKVVKRRVDRSFPTWGLPLIDSINGIKIDIDNKNYRVSVIHATEHRCGVKISGENLSSNITGTDPIKDNLKLRESKPKDPNNSNDILSAKLVYNDKNKFKRNFI